MPKIKQSILRDLSYYYEMDKLASLELDRTILALNSWFLGLIFFSKIGEKMGPLVKVSLLRWSIALISFSIMCLIGSYLYTLYNIDINIKLKEDQGKKENLQFTQKMRDNLEEKEKFTSTTIFWFRIAYWVTFIFWIGCFIVFYCYSIIL